MATSTCAPSHFLPLFFSLPALAHSRVRAQLLIRGVGTTLDTNQEIWMRVTNQSVYRAWNSRHNGVKRRSEGTSIGYFGALNLLGPRSATQNRPEKFWAAQFTLMQLKYEFLVETSAGSYAATRATGIDGVNGLTPVESAQTWIEPGLIFTHAPLFSPWLTPPSMIAEA